MLIIDTLLDLSAVSNNQRSTEGRRSTAVAEGFSPTATASAAEVLRGRRLKFRPKAKIFKNHTKNLEKLG